ncbi:YjcZ family sporulation protein [Paenibacillus motobuensis]|uniref:Dihydroorotate dehydrogenase n=1 Tax=Paenibacillus lutimineralis TaxID=2707005 RepID=A0A3S9V1Y3_9BACL|nr:MULTISPECIES: dihydroorotate dehydrogenase [Paenibacillus]AZS16367.1 dihydroorotate dehydrogenase [Paenibacillus lutimineralis]MCM3038505.1 YjcZ family sporulation protein [Paenibacillus lutimineralis]MCM3645609.1 YjcZ family sporulation protein [Paenibacillus motobuensis]
MGEAYGGNLFTSTTTILVLFILLVIVTRAFFI